MNLWPGAPFWASLHPAGAQNKILIWNTVIIISILHPCSIVFPEQDFQ